MKFCPECGTKRINDSKFCHECGFNYSANSVDFIGNFQLELKDRLEKNNQEPIVNKTSTVSGIENNRTFEKKEVYRDKSSNIIFSTNNNEVVQSYPKNLDPVVIRSMFGGVISSIAFTPNSKYIAACTKYGILIWDIENERKIVEIDTKTDGDKYYSPPADILHFTPDGNYLIYYKQNYVYVIDLFDNTVKNKFKINHSLTKLIISPDGTLFAGIDYTRVVVWNIPEERLVNIISHKEMVESIDFTPDGKYIVIAESKDSYVKFWDFNNLNVAKKFSTYRRPELACIFKHNQIKTSPNGSQITYISEGEHKTSGFIFSTTRKYRSVSLHEIESGKYISSIPVDEDEEIKSIVFSPNGELTLAGMRFGVYLQNNVNNSAKIPIEQRDTYDIDGYIVDFSPNGRLIATSNGEKINIWKLM
ncbi:WD40 repeat protein [Bacillus fengqiuensis]|nr:WD40 repeat protein [Bacillus fengqiuensis]